MSLTCTHKGCTKSFDHPEQRRRHQTVCLFPKKGKPYCTVISATGLEQHSCIKCNKFVSAYKNNIYRHSKVCNGTGNAANGTSNTCTRCRKVFGTPSKLVKHEPTCKKENYKCDKCCKTYNRITYFQAHLTKCYSYETPDSVAEIDCDLSRPTMIAPSPAAEIIMDPMSSSSFIEDSAQNPSLPVNIYQSRSKQ